MVNNIIATRDQGRLHIGAVDAAGKCVRLGTLNSYNNWLTKKLCYFFSTDIQINNKVYRVNTSELAQLYRSYNIQDVNLSDKAVQAALKELTQNGEDFLSKGFASTVRNVSLAGKAIFSQELSPEKREKLTDKLVTNLAKLTQPVNPEAIEIEDKNTIREKIKSKIQKGANCIKEFYKTSVEDGAQLMRERPTPKDLQSTQGHYYSYTPAVFLAEAKEQDLVRILANNKINEVDPPINRKPAAELRIKFSYVVTGYIFGKKIGFQTLKLRKAADDNLSLVRV